MMQLILHDALKLVPFLTEIDSQVGYRVVITLKSNQRGFTTE